MSESSRLEYLNALGIGTWQLRASHPAIIAAAAAAPLKIATAAAVAPAATPVATPVATVTSGVADDVAQMDWTALRARVAGCTRCVLHETRTQTVFGVGDPVFPVAVP